ncbi:MAG TPA: hypothetical protein VKP04_09340 [Ktedonobacteraceae bacterium]|nr:hypothetical protein [Ktedonobacteraceae bacterium]
MLDIEQICSRRVGFPLDLTQKILADRGIKVIVEEYEKGRREQQERSRAVTQFKRGGGSRNKSGKMIAASYRYVAAIILPG